MKEDSLLLIDSVSKRFEETEDEALASFSIKLEKGERLAIVGETGSGKSTLLKIIAGKLESDTGSVFFKGDRVLGPNDKLIAGHDHIAYLSQHFELPKFISVEEHLKDVYSISQKEADLIYASCEISHLLQRDTRELSGGEKQRIALAKLLLSKPEIILLDEPFSNLDFIHKQTVRRVIGTVEKELGTTIILVAHDPIDVLSWAQKVVVLKAGKLMQVSNPNDIYQRPKSLYIAGLFGDYNLLDKTEWRIKGDPQEFNGKVLIRPEQFQETKGEGVAGTVVQIDFCGWYDMVTVKTRNDLVVLYSKSGHYTVDQNLLLCLK